MSENSGEKCTNCRFWKQTTGDAQEAMMMGECRRHAPVNGGFKVLGTHPVTFAGQWCGEYESKQPSTSPTLDELTPGAGMFRNRVR